MLPLMLQLEIVELFLFRSEEIRNYIASRRLKDNYGHSRNSRLRCDNAAALPFALGNEKKSSHSRSLTRLTRLCPFIVLY